MTSPSALSPLVVHRQNKTIFFAESFSPFVSGLQYGLLLTVRSSAPQRTPERNGHVSVLYRRSQPHLSAPEPEEADPHFIRHGRMWFAKMRWLG
jgi:hypothetical protein